MAITLIPAIKLLMRNCFPTTFSELWIAHYSLTFLWLLERKICIFAELGFAEISILVFGPG